ncbi:ATP-binding SpoIIE family protein phosphatase [Streptomyces gilvosporeus]|uniref:protein-serine/threonine phosphatase n=1 Tax=Streptomyces gilvosporeus TaxID=553510 RepID=A0A1V0TW74_9ACTN|nr:ATP-binding SpoIIE family protein phosphatase [Streptomyces gilvosporeus]ARF57196.1 serine/threonine protein phosphatase [Streptomyces gilvosporeus]
MTEHPTSHELRRPDRTAAPSASPFLGTAAAPPVALPDPRSGLQQPAAALLVPHPGAGFAVRGGDDIAMDAGAEAVRHTGRDGMGGGVGGAAATVTGIGRSGGGVCGGAQDEPNADHGPADRDTAGDAERYATEHTAGQLTGHHVTDHAAGHAAARGAASPYGSAYGEAYPDSYREVAMPVAGRPAGVPEETTAARAVQAAGADAVGRAQAPEPGEEPRTGQEPRPVGDSIGRQREGETVGFASGEGAGALPPPAGPPPAPPARSAHPGESLEAAAARQAGGDRLRFIGAATRRIARGIDLDEIVLGLCRATVPTFADAILVYLRDPLPVGDERPTGPVVLRLRRTDRIPEEPDTGGVRLPVMPAQPDLGPAMGGSAAELAEVRPGGPLAEVLRGVRPLFGEAQAARTALPELLGPDPRLPAGHRVILAPLRGRRRVIGAAVFLRRPDRPAFEPDDLLVAAQLATHTALGVDKAVLYGREAYIADALQRTMLPDSLPQPTGVRLASRYLPAAETARVGGDWYDAIPLPGSRVALVVGDVMGHSMTSAAIMGQLRTTAQTLAGLDLPPQEVLHHLDEQAQRLGSDRMATCMYAVYDPVAHRIIIANAGHPPPVMLHRGGRAEVLKVPPGAPIGVGGVDFEAVELDAPAGATLVLYTDGLVESRIRDVWTGIEQLRERLTETARLTGPNPPPLEPLCDEVLDMLGPGDRDDDIALLAARFDGIAPSDVAYWYLDPKAQTAGQARRLARRALARWGLDELTDQLELLVSEVVTNAVRYAERPITLRLLRTDVLRCEVGDDVPQLPRLRQARPSDEGGRGLYLVNRMARRWGATRLSMGKVVWFELSMPSAARA